MLEDALKQATETAKKGKEGVWIADTYVCAPPFQSDTNSYFDFKLESDMVEDRLRHHFDYYLGKTEIVIYSVLAVLLAVTAFVTIATAGQILWIGLSYWTVAAQTLRALNQLLIVLMLVGILHTVRISIRSHVLVTEPFLIVGLIASIRRVLGITLEAGVRHFSRAFREVACHTADSRVVSLLRGVPSIFILRTCCKGRTSSQSDA